MIKKMIPSILKLLDVNQTDQVKEHAIITVNILLLTQASIIGEFMETYIKQLIQMLQQQEQPHSVRGRIIQGMTNVMELDMDIIMNNFQQVTDIMITALKEKDQRVALAATEFLSGVVLVESKN